MKITIEKKVPKTIKLDDGDTLDAEMITVKSELELPDNLITKAIAVADELLDRTYDELEERGWDKLTLPLVPFPFFNKYRNPESVGIDDYWIAPWLDTKLHDIIVERTNIIEFFNKAETLWIDHHPIPNVEVGIFDGDAFSLTLERNKLRELRNKIADELEANSTKKNKQSPVLREQTIEYLSRHLGDCGTAGQIIQWLKSWGVPEGLIDYPNTKWRMVYTVLEHYATSSNEKDHNQLYKIIGEMLHPLVYGGDKKASQEACKEFNQWLEYDDVIALYWDKGKRYVVGPSDELERQREAVEEMENEEKEYHTNATLKNLRKQENKEKISILYKAYPIFMNVVEIYLKNPKKPTTELNEAYTKLKRLITTIVEDLNIHQNGALQHYWIPFNNLYTAEAEYIESRQLESEEDTRRLMHATYGDITELYRQIEGSDVLSEPDVQQTLNDISLWLSELKERETSNPTPNISQEKQGTLDIRIVEMPELQVRDASVSTVSKGKKTITLPKFAPTDWGKVEIRFIDEHNLYIKGDKKVITADYEGLGFANDKNGKPNEAWDFFWRLAKRNGETETIQSPIPDYVKSRKKYISDFLKKLFKNDTDPFYDFSESKTYKLKIALYPPVEEETDNNLGIKEYFDDITSQ